MWRHGVKFDIDVSTLIHLLHVAAAFLRCPLKYTLRITHQFISTENASNHAPRSRGGRRTRHVTHRFDPSPLISQLCIIDDRRDHPMTTSNQPLQGGSNFGDSSGPLFSIYSKAAEEEDNKMVAQWQKDAEGILIFVSPCVHFHLSLHTNWNTIDRSILCRRRSLLAITAQNLRPNSQDTSAFYPGKHYQVLADPNVTRSSTPPPVAELPSFSPP